VTSFRILGTSDIDITYVSDGRRHEPAPRHRWPAYGSDCCALKILRYITSDLEIMKDGEISMTVTQNARKPLLSGISGGSLSDFRPVLAANLNVSP